MQSPFYPEGSRGYLGVIASYWKTFRNFRKSHRRARRHTLPSSDEFATHPHINTEIIKQLRLTFDGNIFIAMLIFYSPSAWCGRPHKYRRKLLFDVKKLNAKHIVCVCVWAVLEEIEKAQKIMVVELSTAID